MNESTPDLSIQARSNLNRRFWLLILGSWTIEEIDNLDGYAKDCERSTRW